MTESAAAWPAPFLHARDLLDPLLRRFGFRAFSAGLEPGREGHAFAEYRRPGLRLRLVWEGHERALWAEHARDQGGEIVSRWVDVEWTVAGERRPLDPALDPPRFDRLAGAVEAFLSDRFGTRPGPP